MSNTSDRNKAELDASDKVNLLTGDELAAFIESSSEYLPRVLILWHREEWTGPNFLRYVVLEKGVHVNNILRKIPEEYYLKDEGRIKLLPAPYEYSPLLKQIAIFDGAREVERLGLIKPDKKFRCFKCRET